MPIHHPHICSPSTHHYQSFPIQFACHPKKLKEGFVLLQETKIHRAEIYLCHNLKTVHPFKNMFHGDMHMDDGNMPNKFQKIPVHGFQKIVLHHLQPFLVFLEISASIGQFFLWGGA